jgi:long-chain-fatty-acid--CoA ligase ACSBG
MLFLFFLCTLFLPSADKMQEVAKTIDGVKKVVSTWAKGEAGAYWDSLSYDGLKEFDLRREAPVPYYMANAVLSAVHKKLGFDRCYGFYVGAAPIEAQILKYFASIDIPIMEIFGQSECTGPHSVNMYTAFKVGTVGRPMLGTETMVAEGSGELCYRGRHVFAGYMGMRDQTNATIDSEGWLHSGDVVSIDDDRDDRIPGKSGFITITGRIKELIITAGGENVPPVLIEAELKRAMPALSNAMVIGDKRKFLTVLLCLRVEVDSEGVPSDKLTGVALDTSKTIGSSASTTEETRADPKWQTYFDQGIEKANEHATSRAQKVGKWLLLDTDFSEKGGELTPTLKLKRSVTAKKYSEIIESMYA